MGTPRARLLIATLFSGVAIYLSSADPLAPWLAWVAASPILVLAFERVRLKPDSTKSDAASRPQGEPASTTSTKTGTLVRGIRLQADSNGALALAAFLAAFAGNLSWAVLYRGILPAPPLLAFAVLFGIAFAATTWLTAWAVERAGAWAGVLLFPSLWTAFEFAVAQWSPHGTAGSLAYSQADFVPLIQVAAWTGLGGITFLMQSVAAGIAAAAAGEAGRRPRWRYLLAPVLVAAVAVALGAWRVRSAAPDVKVAVGLASIDKAMAQSDSSSRENAVPVVTRYLDAVARLSSRQVEAVVMPEKMVGVAPAYESEVSSLFGASAEEHQVLLVAGLNLLARQPARNVAAVFSRGGKALEYDKRHLVPGLERMFVPGSSPAFYKAPGGMTGVAICKDMDFADLGREYSRAGVGLLFVPAWDFTRDAWLHSRMAVMRGVEGGYSVARAAANGYLTGSDSLGRVVAERASDEADTCLALAILPLGRGRTFYAEHGDWFPWAAFIAAAAILVAAATTRTTA